MRIYHPDSWSQQAREMSNKKIWSVNNGWETIEGAIKFFSTSYRHSLIRNRAAKHFGRQVRTGKVHNNMEVYYKHYPNERKDEDV